MAEGVLSFDGLTLASKHEVQVSDPPTPPPKDPSLRNAPGWKLASPPSPQDRKTTEQQIPASNVAVCLRQLRLFFSSAEGGKGYDPATMFGTHAPTDAELVDFLTATSPRTAEDILTHFYGESPPFVQVLGDGPVGNSDSCEQQQAVENKAGVGASAEAGGAGGRKVKRRSSFKKDNEDGEEQSVEKRSSITWADQEKGEVAEVPTREEANQRMLAIMQQHYNHWNHKPSQSSIDLGVDIGVDSTEVGQDDESEDDNSAGFYYDKQPPEIPLPRQHRSNSLQEVHKLEKSYYLPDGWAGVPADTLSEFAAEGTLAGAGLARLQQQMGASCAGGEPCSYDGDAPAPLDANSSSSSSSSSSTHARVVGEDQNGGKLGFGVGAGNGGNAGGNAGGGTGNEMVPDIDIDIEFGATATATVPRGTINNSDAPLRGLTL